MTPLPSVSQRSHAARSGTRARIYGVVAVLLIAGMASLLMRPHDPGRRPTATGSGQAAGAISSPTPATAQADAGVGKDMVPESDTKGDTGVTLLGTVQTESRSLSALQPARISAVLVHEGDQVRRGQLLIRLDASQGLAQQRTATAGVEAAQAQLGKARSGYKAQQIKADADVETAQDGVTQAKEKLQQALLGRDAARDEQQAELAQALENVRKAQLGLDDARRRLDSLTELSKVGGVARNDLEGARTQVAAAQSDRDQAQAQVKRLQAGPPGGASYRIAQAQEDVNAAQYGVSQARTGVATAIAARRVALAVAEQDIQAAMAAVEQARAGEASARDAAQLTVFTSPLDGIVTGLSAHAGETAQPGAVLISIATTTGFHIEALATARQLPALHIGQQAHVTLETRPGTVLSATLSSISRVAEPDGRSFRIKLHLPSPPPNLRPGQTATVKF